MCKCIDNIIRGLEMHRRWTNEKRAGLTVGQALEQKKPTVSRLPKQSYRKHIII